MKEKILIASSWPYANGSLHIGHIASSLPGDILARYFRAKGHQVLYVSGSDCYGTPVSIRAKQENRTPEEISSSYHEEFSDCFQKLGFSYDHYGKTSDPTHINFVTEFHKTLYKSNYIYEETAPQAYCGNCERFLVDRFVTGLCPGCHTPTRGDQCDQCGAVTEPAALLEPKCTLCGQAVVWKDSAHLYLKISALKDELTSFIRNSRGWRKNARTFSEQWLADGLRDRAVTRDLDWGILVPREGYENKRIYIWAENVLGYLSASQEGAKKHGWSFTEFWSADTQHYYIHGKDNIPFHTIILPALLLAHGGGWHLPDQIISSEYLTLEGRKISTSQNYAVWVKDIADRLDPDSLRYFLTANGPEKRDTDFTWTEYVKSHNGELLGAYGNLIHRSLTFVNKYFGGQVPAGSTEPDVERKFKALYQITGAQIEAGQFKDALEEIFTAVRGANKYFDEKKPWSTRNTDFEDCQNTLYNCIQIIGNLAVLLAPFLPFSSAKVTGWLKLNTNWAWQVIPTGLPIPEAQILFQRLEEDYRPESYNFHT